MRCCARRWRVRSLWRRAPGLVRSHWLFCGSDRLGRAYRLRRRFERAAACAVSAERRSARFTDWLSGNRLARSGSIRTRLVPPVARRWYFPRTPPLSCERSYSFRKLSFSVSAGSFFILIPFRSRRQPRAETSVGVHSPCQAPSRCATSPGMIAVRTLSARRNVVSASS